ncbi:MAG TPA: HAD family hydrolase [Roseiflexaceae bacterium]|nr:HAD family hydrolase [Roseiflexaceae bacterium]HMP41348.1 HAD family hydrolase [Roseiflexaceae bacterium]
MQLRAICFDFGDTLADEATEEKDEQGVTQRAALLPGAAELITTLRRRGYPLALVADGYAATYTNVLGRQYGLLDAFRTLAISELVGVEKPHARMFTTALDALGIAAADYGATMMVGNYLARDVYGANALGMISVWIDWAPRRPKVPAQPLEVPQYTIRLPLELLDVIAVIEGDRLP